VAIFHFIIGLKKHEPSLHDPAFTGWWPKQHYLEALNKWHSSEYSEWLKYEENVTLFETCDGETSGVCGAEKGWGVCAVERDCCFGAQWRSQSVPLSSARMGIMFPPCRWSGLHTGSWMGIMFPPCRWSGLHTGSWAFTLILELNVSLPLLTSGEESSLSC